MIQETLEEAAENLYPKDIRTYRSTYQEEVFDNNEFIRNTFISGAKWQEQRMFSEKEVYTIQQISDLFIPDEKSGYFDDYLDYRIFTKDEIKLNFKDWFEQFKKK